MYRNCIIVHSSAVYKRHICVDVENAYDILNYLLQDDQHKKKYMLIVDRILNRPHIYFDLYAKEDIDKKCRNVAAMKFPMDNGRIYCQEVSTFEGTFYIVASKLLPRKKSQKVNKSIIPIIKTVASYEYEIIATTEGLEKEIQRAFNT